MFILAAQGHDRFDLATLSRDWSKEPSAKRSLTARGPRPRAPHDDQSAAQAQPPRGLHRRGPHAQRFFLTPSVPFRGCVVQCGVRPAETPRHVTPAIARLA